MNLSSKEAIERIKPVAPAHALLKDVTVKGTQITLIYSDDLSAESHNNLCAFIDGIEALTAYEVGAEFPEY